MSRPELTRAVAEAQPGAHDFVTLQDGFTHFDWVGPKDAHPIVLICGMSTPSIIWDACLPHLVAAGYQVLRYDFFGRGWSERPDVRYDLSLYLRQLQGLISQTLGARPFTLVAYSWGAGLGAAYAHKHMRQVQQLVLLAPGGLSKGQAFALGLLGAPGLGPALIGGRAKRLLRGDLRQCFVAPEAHEAFIERTCLQDDFRGFSQAYLRSAASMPRRFDSLYSALRSYDGAVHALWGDADTKVPHRLFTRLATHLPAATLHLIPGGAHAVQVEAPQAFSQHLVNLLPAPGLGPDVPATR